MAIKYINIYTVINIIFLLSLMKTLLKIIVRIRGVPKSSKHLDLQSSIFSFVLAFDVFRFLDRENSSAVGCTLLIFSLLIGVRKPWYGAVRSRHYNQHIVKYQMNKYDV